MTARRRPRLRSGIERAEPRECPAHRQWVRGHACLVPGCEARGIEAAHVRKGTDGGMGLKPNDRWCVPLCRDHHSEQHRIGEDIFAKRYGLDLGCEAEALAARSPHLRRVAI